MSDPTCHCKSFFRQQRNLRMLIVRSQFWSSGWPPGRILIRSLPDSCFLPMPPKGIKRGRSSAHLDEGGPQNAQEQLQSHTLSSQACTHEVMMQTIWQKLYSDKQAAMQVFVQLTTGCFNAAPATPEVASAARLTTNNKFSMCPREVWDGVLDRKARSVKAYFHDKVKNRVCGFVCWVCNISESSAVFSKDIAVLIEKICDAWDENIGQKLDGIPMVVGPIDNERMQQCGYFIMTSVTDSVGDKQVLQFHGGDGSGPTCATLPDAWQSLTWQVVDGCFFSKATIKAGEWDEHKCTTVFSRSGTTLTPPLSWKTVPTGIASSPAASRAGSSPRTPFSNASASAPSASMVSASPRPASAGSAADRITFDHPPAAEPAVVPRPPPPPGTGSAIPEDESQA